MNHNPNLRNNEVRMLILHAQTKHKQIRQVWSNLGVNEELGDVMSLKHLTANFSKTI